MAFRVKQQVAGLEITMQKISRVHVLETLQALVNDVLLVDIFQDVRSNDGMQVSVHKVEDKIDVAIIFGTNRVLQANNVLVTVQFLQKDNLSEGPLGIRGILESVKILLERDNFLGTLVNSLPHDTVGTFTEFLNDLVLLKNVSFDFLRHFFRIKI